MVNMGFFRSPSPAVTVSTFPIHVQIPLTYQPTYNFQYCSLFSDTKSNDTKYSTGKTAKIYPIFDKYHRVSKPYGSPYQSTDSKPHLTTRNRRLLHAKAYIKRKELGMCATAYHRLSVAVSDFLEQENNEASPVEDFATLFIGGDPVGRGFASGYGKRYGGGQVSYRR